MVCICIWKLILTTNWRMNWRKKQDYIEGKIVSCIKILLGCFLWKSTSLLSYTDLLLICCFPATQRKKIRGLHLKWYVFHSSTQFEIFCYFLIFTNYTMLNIFVLFDCMYTFIFSINTIIIGAVRIRWWKMSVF